MAFINYTVTVAFWIGNMFFFAGVNHFMKMKRNHLSFIIGVLTVISINTSCKEDEEINRTDLLTDKSWVISSAEASQDGKTKDASAEYTQECDKDDILFFTKDGKFSDKVGAKLCETDEIDQTGTWTWKENEKVLSITTVDYSSDLGLVSLSKTKLQLSYYPMSYDMNGDNIEETNVKMTLTFIVK